MIHFLPPSKTIAKYVDHPNAQTIYPTRVNLTVHKKRGENYVLKMDELRGQINHIVRDISQTSPRNPDIVA